MIKRAFCWLYDYWIQHWIATKDAPLVRFLDYFFGSACKYCMATRALMAGFGVGLAVCGVLPGVLLFGLAWLMAYGERKWLCETKEGGDGNQVQG